MRHCWPTTPNIVECYLLRPFAHPVACCCAKFETGQTLSYKIQRDATVLLFAVCHFFPVFSFLPHYSMRSWQCFTVCFFYVVSKVSAAQKLNRCRNRKPLRRRRGEVKVICKTSSPRPLPHRFIFRPQIQLSRSWISYFTNRIRKNTPRNASYAS